jgi:hypothetical protein
MANLPDRTDDQRRVDHGGQSGHFYLAESGHFYLGITLQLRIMYIMSNSGYGEKTKGAVAPHRCWHPVNIHEPRLAHQ